MDSRIVPVGEGEENSNDDEHRDNMTNKRHCGNRRSLVRDSRVINISRLIERNGSTGSQRWTQIREWARSSRNVASGISSLIHHRATKHTPHYLNFRL